MRQRTGMDGLLGATRAKARVPGKMANLKPAVIDHICPNYEVVTSVYPMPTRAPERPRICRPVSEGSRSLRERVARSAGRATFSHGEKDSTFRFRPIWTAVVIDRRYSGTPG